MGRITPTPRALRRRSRAGRLLWLALPAALLSGGAPARDGARRGIRVMNGMKAWNGLAAGGGDGLGGGVEALGALARGGGLAATAEQRETFGYLVRCALPAGRSIAVTDANGGVHSFSGQVGLAPEWEAAACGPTCQRWVSACLLSLINTTGEHRPIWMAASHAAIGWGRNGDLPIQEGAFFGNLFASPPAAHYCAGRDFGRSPLPGRIGGAQAAVPYDGDAGPRGPCASVCTAHGGDGFEACGDWKEVITVWHR